LKKTNGPVDGNVEPHEFNKCSIVTKAEQSGKVVRVVLLHVNRRELTATIDIAVNATCNVWKLGNPGDHVNVKWDSYSKGFLQVHRVLEHWAPIFLFRDALSISLGKCRVVVQLRSRYVSLNDRVQKTRLN
jgi:hypothetical protein